MCGNFGRGTRSRLTSQIVGLVQVEINMLMGYINCEHLIILTCKLGSKLAIDETSQYDGFTT